MSAVKVELGARSYPIHVGCGLLGRAELLEPHLPGHQVLVVSNETVAPLYLEAARRGFGDREVVSLMLPDGEEHKRLEEFAQIVDRLVEARFARDCVVAALGGGVVGDLAGFAAACYQRGVALVQIPTTLLAQVDSSVGGKTAVNHPRGKNLVGTFHQPACVIADVDTLRTLPPRELRAGLAEVIKYGLIRDLGFLEWIEAHLDALLALDADALTHAVRRSCEHKAQVVAGDEREHAGRATLNLGHTFGHAIEAGLGYGTWLHGEAVAAGACLAARLSARMGWLGSGEVERVERLMERAGLPTAAPETLDAARLLELMAHDKKVRGGRIRLVLLRRLGEAVVTDEFDPGALDAVLART